MALAPEGAEIDRVYENKTWYTKSVSNSSKEKRRISNLENEKVFNKAAQIRIFKLKS